MFVKRKVPFFNYPFVFQQKEEELLGIVKDVGRRGAFIMQHDLREFEAELASFVGAKYAVGVANATDGLQIGLMAGGLKQGDEVIICSHTMVATAAAIHYAGGVAVPIDAAEDHLIDVSKIETAITNKTRAIMPTQLNGRTTNMDVVNEIARKYNLDIYEDAAQALGSKFKGKSAGTFGIASAISFYPAKLLGTFGDGGAVLTNDEGVYDELMLLRDHGRNSDGNIVAWGMNSRLDNLHAAILKFFLKEYDQVITRRREIASIYEKKLSSIEALKLPPAPGVDENHFDVFQNYEIEAQRRDALKNHLSKNGVGTLVQWGGEAIHQLTHLGFKQNLPDMDRLFERMLMIPMNMSLTDEDVDYVCDCIASYYN